MQKLKLTFSIDQEEAGKLLAAAIDLKAELDSVGLVEVIPYTKNLPVMVERKANGKIDNYNQWYKSSNGTYKKKSNGAALVACLKYIRQQGDSGGEYEELKDIYSQAGARPMGIFHALKAIATQRHGRWYVRPDGKIHGKPVTEIET